MATIVRAPFLIGVTGGTASGKTSVCNKLIAKLKAGGQGYNGLLHVAQDSFYRDLSAEEAFAFDEISSTLLALKSGRPATIPHYDFVTSSRVGSGTVVGNAGVVLVFVDTDADTRLARRVRRDITERGRDVLAVLAQYERTVKPSFDEWILPTRKFADIIVPRGAENTAAIDILFQHIRYQLAQRSQPAP